MTPKWWPYTCPPAVATHALKDHVGAAIALPAFDEVVKDADHLVGYQDGFVPPTRVVYWSGGARREVAMANRLATRSHSHQR